MLETILPPYFERFTFSTFDFLMSRVILTSHVCSRLHEPPRPFWCACREKPLVSEMRREQSNNGHFSRFNRHLPLPHICLHNNKLNAIIHGCDGGKKCEREREKEMAISTQRQIGFYPLMLYVRQHMQANFSEVRTALLSQIKLCSARWS